jgi:hypothetical protein
MSPWERLLERPQSRGHFVQVYEADMLSLTRNVSHYVWEGLKRGDGLLLISTPEHWKLFCQHLNELGADTERPLQNRQLVFLDARETLSQFMVKGQPDWRRFEAVIGAAMGQIRKVNNGAGLRAYGEMVALLWKARQFAAAVRLEQLWNKLLAQSSFSLYCAYAIDVFGKEFHVEALDGLLCAHTHLIPAAPNGELEAALNLAMDEILGPKAHNLKALIKANYRPSWGVVPNAESMVLWLRKNLPIQAEDIIARARNHYHISRQPCAALPSDAKYRNGAGSVSALD